jgi:hypothetical protein
MDDSEDDAGQPSYPSGCRLNSVDGLERPLHPAAYRLPHSKSLPRRLHQRSKSAGSSILKPYAFTSTFGSIEKEEIEEPDAEIQQRLQREMRMHDGTTKLLQAAQHPMQLLEGSKSLIVSEERMKCFRNELQLRKAGGTLTALWSVPEGEGCNGDDVQTNCDSKRGPSTPITEESQVPCRATLSLNEIRIPLMWQEKEHFRNRGYLRRFAVFCLIRLGSQICDTSLVTSVDRSATDVSFDDVLVLKKVPHDFECHIEVYAQNLDVTESSGTPSLIRRKFNHVTSSVGRTMGRRVAARIRDDGAEFAGANGGPG